MEVLSESRKRESRLMDVAREAARQGKVNTVLLVTEGQCSCSRSWMSGNWRLVLWLRYRPNPSAYMNGCSYQDEPAN